MGNRKLGRNADHRIAMLRGMVTFLLENGQIETTVTRAKEVRCLAEKMITLGKVNTLHNKRQALSFITKEDVVKKLFDEISPRFAERNGGYTQILRIGPRVGDGAEMALIILIGNAEVKAAAEVAAKADKKNKKKDKKVEKAPKADEKPAAEAPAAEEPKAEEKPAAEAAAE